jgi:hypothetical protein
MAKQRKTAHELKDIVAARLGVGDVLLAVYNDRTDGWRATVLTTLQRTNKIQHQARVDEIVVRAAERIRFSGIEDGLAREPNHSLTSLARD